MDRTVLDRRPASLARTRSADDVSSLISPFLRLDRSTTWRSARSIRLAFETFHPQGLTRVGDTFFLSTVEVLQPTGPTGPGGVRAAGRGVGHLFAIEADGTRRAQIRLGDATRYHPGGIDTDGTDLWVPVAEYRPNSTTTVYRIDADTLVAHAAFEVDDHIGAIVVNPCADRLHGMSWGSRLLYTWTPDGTEVSVQRNRSHFVDYQDCQFLAPHHVIGAGIALLDGANPPIELGGLALLDVRDGRIIHEVPVSARSSAGHALTRNPMHLEDIGGGLRLWVAPDDGDEIAGTELLAFDATPTR